MLCARRVDLNGIFAIATLSTPGARRGAQDLRREGQSHGGAATARCGERRLTTASRLEDALPRQRLLPGKLRFKGDRLELAVQRPSSLNTSGLMVDGRNSTRSGHRVAWKADVQSRQL